MEKIIFNPEQLSALLLSTKIDIKKVKKLNPASYSVNTTAKKVMYFTFFNEKGEFIAQFAENGVETTSQAKKYFEEKLKAQNLKREKKRDEEAKKKRDEHQAQLEKRFFIHNAVVHLVKEGSVAIEAFNSMNEKKLQNIISEKISSEIKDKFLEIPFAEIKAYVLKK